MSIRKSLNNLNQRISDHRTLVDSYPFDHREGDWLSLQSTCNWDSQRTFTIAQLSHTVNRSRRTLRVGGVAQLNKILFFCDSHNGDRIVILTANLRTVKLFLFQSEILNHWRFFVSYIFNHFRYPCVWKGYTSVEFCYKLSIASKVTMCSAITHKTIHFFFKNLLLLTRNTHIQRRLQDSHGISRLLQLPSAR